MNFFADPKKAAINAIASIIFFTLTVFALQSRQWILLTVYSMGALLYAGLTLLSLSIFHIDEEQVSQRFLGKAVCTFPLSQLREFGLANMKVMANDTMTKIGEVYIYLSDRRMEPEERLNMCLRWPVKDVCYLRFSKSRLQAVRKYIEKQPILFWMTEDAFVAKFKTKLRG